MLRAVFMGTPDFAVPVLQTLFENYLLVCAYTQPPRLAGRGQQELKPSPVQKWAEENGVSVRHPTTLKSKEEADFLTALAPDVIVVCAYGLLLPKNILDLPKYGCINVHASLLPRWRGAAPIQRAIMAGDTQTGISIMQMDTGLDTGAVFAQKIVPILPTTTAGELHDALAQTGAQLLKDVLDSLPMPTTPQPQEGMTYAAKLTSEDSHICWDEDALLVVRRINALNPVPKAYCMHGKERINVLQADYVDLKTDKAPGTVLDKDLTVACGQGTCVRLKLLQRAGRHVLSTSEFVRGYKISAGDVLS